MNRMDLPNNSKTCIIEHLDIGSARFDHISTMTRCVFHGTEIHLTLKLTLMPKKQWSWQSSKFRMR